MPDLDENPLDYSAEFWKNIADYFKNTPNVIFEIYNEPVGMSDSEWKRCAESLYRSYKGCRRKAAYNRWKSGLLL